MFWSECWSWLKSAKRGQGRHMLSFALAYSTRYQTGDRKHDRSDESEMESSDSLSRVS